ncbi:Transcription factor HES-5 [Ilyodon furcidens]|uniref:Transcription factor HES-5 n=1 Tax=Ilyodon furcidens TaxID=33524 RepID=A0ABV0V9Y8_9TELE
MTDTQEHLTLNHKLKKALVEMLHRDRMNNSIEQLKSLLGPEFLKQQMDSKLEKADSLLPGMNAAPSCSCSHY